MFVLLNLRYFDNLKFLRNGIRILSLLQNFLTVQTLHNQLSLQPTIIQSRINSIIEYEKKNTTVSIVTSNNYLPPKWKNI